MYWAEELAKQNRDLDLKVVFGDLANQMKSNEVDIIKELNRTQGNIEDIKGYYFPDADATFTAMRPSSILNTLIDNF